MGSAIVCAHAWPSNKSETDGGAHARKEQNRLL